MMGTGMTSCGIRYNIYFLCIECTFLSPVPWLVSGRSSEGSCWSECGPRVYPSEECADGEMNERDRYRKELHSTCTEA